jgi:DNA-binding MarR family transcriptional regulator
MEKSAASSLDQMAEEIFSLTVMSWRERLAARDGTELSETQYLAIESLANSQQPLTVGEIQRAIGVLPAQMSRIILSLEQGFDKPLIRRELNQHDKRKIDVHLLPEGREMHQEFRRSRLSKTVEILKNLSDKDRQEFVRICRRIRELVATHESGQ